MQHVYLGVQWRQLRTQFTVHKALDGQTSRGDLTQQTSVYVAENLLADTKSIPANNYLSTRYHIYQSASIIVNSEAVRLNTALGS